MPETNIPDAHADSIGARCIVQKDRLQLFLDTMTGLVDEARLHFKANDLVASAVDPANVSMVRPVRLNEAAFEAWDVDADASTDELTIAVNLHALADRISNAGASELVELAVDLERRHLLVRWGAVSHSVALIDPDAVRDEPELPDLDLPNTATVVAEDLDQALTNADVTGADHVSLSADAESGQLLIEAWTNTDEFEFEFDADRLVAAHVPESTESLFSLEYLEEIVGPIPSDAEVSLTFGDEFPVILDWEAAEGDFQAKAMVAPRIQSE